MIKASRLTRLYRFLAPYLFFELLGSSLLVAALLVSLRLIGFPVVQRFLYWNLLLAWVPYLSALLAIALYRSSRPLRYLALLPGLIWLAFFPNAPYIVTDVVHMYEIAPHGWGFNLGVILIFAWIGLVLAVVSLHIVHTIFRERYGTLWGWVSVLLFIALGAIGILLGRVERWNSWDVLTHPQVILKDVVVPLLQPRTHLGFYGFIVVYAALLLICYVTFYAGRRTPGESRRETDDSR
jgi:uncharacterized membrane protein